MANSIEVVADRPPQLEPHNENPRKWKVVILNDDFTPMDYVTTLFVNIFNKTVEDAIILTRRVHHDGKAVAGVYPFDVAETKISYVAALSREHEYPLRAILTPE